MRTRCHSPPESASVSRRGEILHAGLRQRFVYRELVFFQRRAPESKVRITSERDVLSHLHAGMSASSRCGTTATICASSGYGSVWTSRPSIAADPRVISARRSNAFTIELLPDPFGPASAVSFPRGPTKLTPSTALRRAPRIRNDQIL